MAYENPFLTDFASIFFEIVKMKGFDPAKLEVVIFDEEVRDGRSFEKNEVLDVLYQLGVKLNALTIYTDRPRDFYALAEGYSEETGLVTVLASKREQKKALVKNWSGDRKIILDFEKKGSCYGVGRYAEYGYIPIYKKPWEIAENLDIIVPFGYNIVIVKGRNTKGRQCIRDRFDVGFYRDE